MIEKTDNKDISAKQSIKQHGPIKSYVLRQGRLTPGQARAMNKLWPDFGVDMQQDTINWSQLFNREAPLVLEIGFGMGGSLIQQALAEPDKNFIGIEVHKPGVGACLIEIDRQHVQNLRLINGDAIEALKWMFADNSLTRVQLYFPDPWHKKRHNKRRIVRPEFVQTIHSKLISNGRFHMATDWEPYAENMLEVMAEATYFQNMAKDKQYIPRPDFRPLTKFEQRGQRLGHGVWDLMYEKM